MGGMQKKAPQRWPGLRLLSIDRARIRQRAARQFFELNNACFASSGADVRVDVYRCMKNSHDQQFIVAEWFVEDDVHAVRKLPVALAEIVAGLAHPGILRQGVEDPIELFQVGVPLAHAPAFLGVSRDRLQIRQGGSAEVECAHFCSASNSDTSAS